MAYNPEADKKWREANKEKVAHGNARRMARRFVNAFATEEELEELIAQATDKLKELRAKED